MAKRLSITDRIEFAELEYSFSRDRLSVAEVLVEPVLKLYPKNQGALIFLDKMKQEVSIAEQAYIDSCRAFANYILQKKNKLMLSCSSHGTRAIHSYAIQVEPIIPPQQNACLYLFLLLQAATQGSKSIIQDDCAEIRKQRFVTKDNFKAQLPEADKDILLYLQIQSGSVFVCAYYQEFNRKPRHSLTEEAYQAAIHSFGVVKEKLAAQNIELAMEFAFANNLEKEIFHSLR